MPLDYLPPMKKRIPDRILREFRGVNKQDRYSIADYYATAQHNMASDAYPALSVRAGFSLIGTEFGQAINGIGLHKGTTPHVITGGSWYRLVDGDWSSSLKDGLSTSTVMSFANFKGGFSDIFLLAANGVDRPQVFNGTTVSNLSGAPAKGNYVATYDNRVFMAVDNLLYASGLNLATDWSSVGDDSSSYQISIDTQNGETINGLAPGIGHLTIFKPNSIHELYGSSPFDVRVEAITFEVGAINNQSVFTLNGIMYLIHRTGIFRYGGGSRPSKDFSLPVQEYIDSMNHEASGTCCAGTDGRKLYFSIPTGSSTVPDTTLVYDPMYDMWNVYRDFSPLLFALSSSGAYIGLDDGRVIQPGGTTDTGAPISWEWVSKPFGGTSYSQKIRWTRMWIFCDVPAGSTLNAFVSPSPTGDSDWLPVGTISPKTSVQNARIMLQPSAAFSNFLRIKFSGTGPVKIHEWDRMQVEFSIV